MGICRRHGNNEGILLLATLASIQIAQELDREQIELLSAFFEVLGDNLALLITPSCRSRTFEHTAENAED